MLLWRYERHGLEFVEKLQSFAKELAEVDRLASSPTPRWLSFLDNAGVSKPKD